MSPKVYIMVGLSGSGKTKIAREIAEDRGADYWGLNKIRVQYAADHGIIPDRLPLWEEPDSDTYQKVYQFCQDNLEDFYVYSNRSLAWTLYRAREGGVIVLDNMHLSAKARKNLIRRTKLEKENIQLVFVDTPVEICKTRSTRRIPEEHWTRHIEEFDYASADENVKIIKGY
jgi:predicted kinase